MVKSQELVVDPDLCQSLESVSMLLVGMEKMHVLCELEMPMPTAEMTLDKT